MCHLARSTHSRPTVDPHRHRGPPDTPACRDTRPPAVRRRLQRHRAFPLRARLSVPLEPSAIRHNLIAPFSSSSPLAFPLRNQLFSLHISPSPNPTSRRFHFAPRPPIIAITLPYKGASPMALFNLWLVLIHFLSKRSV